MIAFDAVGPSSSGASSSGSTSLSWTHTVGGGVTSGAILVAVNFDTGGNGGTLSATCAGVSMTSLGHVDCLNSTGTPTQGFIQLFLATGVATGANAIAVTSGGSAGTPAVLVGGSLSFSGYAGNGTVVTIGTLSGGGSTGTVTVSSSTSGNIIAGFLASGNSITGVSTGTSRFVNNVSGSGPNDTGDAAGATNSAGGSVSIVWATASTSYAAIAVEMQGSNVTSGPPLGLQALVQAPVTVPSVSGWRNAARSR